MNDISVKKINKLIEQFEEEGNKTQALEIGYKTYAMLMSDQKFADKVTKSAENSEPYRVCRRVNILRDYPDDKIKIYP